MWLLRQRLICAEDVGLFEKRVILPIDRQPDATVEDVVKIQSTLKAGDAVALRIVRPGPEGRGAAPHPGYLLPFRESTTPNKAPTPNASATAASGLRLILRVAW